jgi:hypothetical protein
MNTTMVRDKVSLAIKEKRIIIVKYIKEDEVLPTETRLIPLDIVEEIRGIAKHQSYLIGFEVGYVMELLEESDFRKFVIETISEIRITGKYFKPEEATKLYHQMKRTPTVAWNISRHW